MPQDLEQDFECHHQLLFRIDFMFTNLEMIFRLTNKFKENLKNLKWTHLTVRIFQRII